MLSHRRLGLVFCFLAVLVLTATVARAQEQDDGSPDQVVTLRKEFSVAFPANLSTGYSWQVVSYDRNYLQLQGRKYRRPDNPRPGAEGTELFEFLPLKTGTTTIIFQYKRPWESQAVRDLTYRVRIK